MDDLSLSQWDNEVVIGKGGSSTVYRARLKLNGRFVAVKQVETDGMTRDQVSGIKGEIETSRGLSHANIISYLGAIQKQNNIFILLEYADRGSLRQFYQKHGKLTEAHTVYCLRQILDGLSYLHSNGYTHRDVKCANCLLCSDGSVKLADFGASKKFDSHSIVSGLKGTPQWMSPEVIKGTQLTTGWMQADVWSLGCTVVEMVTGRVPYADYENPMTAMYKIAGGEVPPIKSDITISPPLRSVIYLCCNVDPQARPLVKDLLRHELFRECTTALDPNIFRTDDFVPIQSPLPKTADNRQRSVDVDAPSSSKQQPRVESSADDRCDDSSDTLKQHMHYDQNLASCEAVGSMNRVRDGGQAISVNAADATRRDVDNQSMHRVINMQISVSSPARQRHDNNDSARVDLNACSGVDCIATFSSKSQGQSNVFAQEEPTPHLHAQPTKEICYSIAANADQPTYADSPLNSSKQEARIRTFSGGSVASMNSHADSSHSLLSAALVPRQQLSAARSYSLDDDAFESSSSTVQAPLPSGHQVASSTASSNSAVSPMLSPSDYISTSLLQHTLGDYPASGTSKPPLSSSLKLPPQASNSDFDDPCNVVTLRNSKTNHVANKDNTTHVNGHGALQLNLNAQQAELHSPRRAVQPNSKGGVFGSSVNSPRSKSRNLRESKPLVEAVMHNGSASSAQFSLSTHGGAVDLAMPSASFADNSIAMEEGRPNAPLSGEKLLLHTELHATSDMSAFCINSAPKPSSHRRDSSNLSDSERLQRIGQSGAASIRRNATLEMNGDMTLQGVSNSPKCHRQSLSYGNLTRTLLKNTSTPSLFGGTASGGSSSKHSNPSNLLVRSFGNHKGPNSHEIEKYRVDRHPSYVPQRTLSIGASSIRSQSAGVGFGESGGMSAAHMKLQGRRNQLPPMAALSRENAPNNIDVQAEQSRERLSMTDNAAQHSLEYRFIHSAPAAPRLANLPPISAGATTMQSQTPDKTLQQRRG